MAERTFIKIIHPVRGVLAEIYPDLTVSVAPFVEREDLEHEIGRWLDHLQCQSLDAGFTSSSVVGVQLTLADDGLTSEP